MNASEMSLLEDFIKGAIGSQFVIPIYQRKYTWEKNKQIKRFLNDLNANLKVLDKSYFLGTIYYANVSIDFLIRKREIVEGQQRLITVFLTLAALVKIAKEEGKEDLAQKIKQDYLENPKTDKYKLRLNPGLLDQSAYKQIINDNLAEYNDDSRMLENYQYIYESLTSLNKQYDLEQILNALKRFFIIRIEIDSQYDVQEIFETVNGTGQTLSIADLILNFITMLADQKTQEAIYQKYWLHLEKCLEDPKTLAEFLRFYLARKNYQLSAKEDLCETFKTYWRAKDGQNNYEVLLEDMLNYGKHYQRLYLQNNTDELGEVIKDFQRLGMVIAAPFAMSVLEHLQKKKSRQSKLKRYWNY